MSAENTVPEPVEDCNLEEIAAGRKLDSKFDTGPAKSPVAKPANRRSVEEPLEDLVVRETAVVNTTAILPKNLKV